MLLALLSILAIFLTILYGTNIVIRAIYRNSIPSIQLFILAVSATYLMYLAFVAHH